MTTSESRLLGLVADAASGIASRDAIDIDTRIAFETFANVIREAARSAGGGVHVCEHQVCPVCDVPDVPTRPTRGEEIMPGGDGLATTAPIHSIAHPGAETAAGQNGDVGKGASPGEARATSQDAAHVPPDWACAAWPSCSCTVHCEKFAPSPAPVEYRMPANLHECGLYLVGHAGSPILNDYQRIILRHIASKIREADTRTLSPVQPGDDIGKLLGRLRSLESHLGESHTVDDFDKETVHQAIIALTHPSTRGDRG